MGIKIGIGIGIGSSGSSWTSRYYTLSSGPIRYKREINRSAGTFTLWYSEDFGVTWENLETLDLTEPSVLIDLAHIYHHRIVDYEYRVDNFINPIGYAGVEGVDWENLYTASPYHVLLPQKLIVTPDVYTEEMDATTGWSTTRATLESNVTEKHSGSASIKMTSTTAGSTAVMDKVVNLNLSADNGASFRLWVYPHTVPAITFTNIQIMLGSDGTFAHCFSVVYIPDSPVVLQNVWTLLWGNAWTVLAGNPLWNNINAIRIKITNPVTQAGIISFDLATEGIVVKSSILLMFDDGNNSDYTKAYPLIKAKKMVATSYLISSQRGAGNLTDNQLIELNANKWDIANHTVNHPLVEGAMTVQDFINEMEGCRAYLDNIGLTRSSKHIGATGNAYCDDWVTAATNWGAKTLRPGSTAPNIYSSEFPYHINAGGDAVPTLVKTKAYIDKAILNKWTPMCYIHKIVDANPGVGEWLTSDIALLIDYIESLGLQTLTIDEYYRLYVGPITVFHK